jgi:hypothetical protein
MEMTSLYIYFNTNKGHAQHGDVNGSSAATVFIFYQFQPKFAMELWTSGKGPRRSFLIRPEFHLIPFRCDAPA